MRNTYLNGGAIGELSSKRASDIYRLRPALELGRVFRIRRRTIVPVRDSYISGRQRSKVGRLESAGGGTRADKSGSSEDDGREFEEHGDGR